MSLPDALAAARAAVATAAAAPLSRKKAMLAALLIDAVIDALFTASGEDDVLAYRAALHARAPALGPILDLVAMKETMLVIEPVDVPLSAYPGLGVEDFMVSLYNGRTVPRVLIAPPDSAHIDVHMGLAAALRALEDEAAA
jgi:hypothetical protein